MMWKFRIYSMFREIFKFRENMNNLRNITKSVFAHIIRHQSQLEGGESL